MLDLQSAIWIIAGHDVIACGTGAIVIGFAEKHDFAYLRVSVLYKIPKTFQLQSVRVIAVLFCRHK